MNRANQDRTWLKEVLLVVLCLVCCSLVARVHSSSAETEVMPVAGESSCAGTELD
jgi:hypothetical protein